MKPEAILMMGKAGSGKGTQAPRIAEHYKAVHMSTGDMFREEYNNKTDLGIKAHSCWGAGSLVPDDLTVSMIKEKLEGIERTVLDGFPRTIPQAEALDKIVVVSAAISLEVSDPVAAGRMANRLVCTGCNTIYGLARTPLNDETCGCCNGRLTRREDDTNPTKIRRRLEEYREKTEPLLDFYEKRGILHSIDADKDPDKVFSMITDALDNNP